MDTATARELIALNTKFYQDNAESFRATRSAPWEGWRQAVPHLEEALRTARKTQGVADDAASYMRANPASTLQEPDASVVANNSAATILDLACGNLRFERFLSDTISRRPLVVHAVDNCGALAAQEPATANVESAAIGIESTAATVVFHDIDILRHALAHGIAGETLSRLPGVPLCDVSVCFGFMHHVPSIALRERVLQLLAEHTRPGGVIVASFWQFMHDEKLARKADAAAAFARSHPDCFRFNLDEFEPGDQLLGWQDTDSIRYCHHFDDEEIDELVASVSNTGIRELARYSADGKSHALNRYVVFRRA